MADPRDDHGDHDAETTAPAPADQDPTLVAGRYRIVRTLGRGGGGQVWLATDENLGRQVALKQVAGEADTELLLSRGFREARTSATLAHQHVVRVYDAFEHDGSPWIVMEFVEGPSLAELIADGQRLPPAQVAAIGAQMATALAAAHQAGILHRDVKPANVLLTGGAGHDAKLTDFGIARADEDPQLTRTGFVSGTAAYFSPELARGEEPSTASDVWALGATLYAAVEGRRPFEERANAVAQLHTIARDDPRPPQHAGELTPALAGMLDPDPATRWDAQRAARELEQLVRGGRGGAAGAAGAAAAGAAAAGAGAGVHTERVPRADPTRTFAQPTPAPTPTAQAARPAASRAAPAAAGQHDEVRRTAPSGRRPGPRRGVWLSWLLIVPLALLLGWLVWTIATGSEGGTGTADPTSSASASGTDSEPVAADEARDLAQRFYTTLADEGLDAARQLTLPEAYIASDIEVGLQSISAGDLSAQEQADGSATVTGLVTYTYDVSVIEQEETLTVVRGQDGPVVALRQAVEVQSTPRTDGGGSGDDEAGGDDDR
ncbi:hypothetical protein BJF80_10375 [Serinicoccus sp. CUA-874]|uniref:serine/threonine-protein kinase n=1 Tax=Serinicoccus sp. CUA-874 TaxID=1517939 RepID=UPI00095BCD61|nr:serine/threonine-protein kinase [Serinicoccus sp. CUA-874]OLT15269.1 hypothetical protein BJF80_10375 [Serinicoccus sp. CUA-874]